VRVSKLVEAVNSHSGATDWKMEDACRELKLDISFAYAARLFRRDTGVGVREYAKRRRVIMASECLAATELPIKAIASELGYRQASNFTRFFKKQNILSPTRFRSRNS
jgi:two-component system response regulator YesN